MAGIQISKNSGWIEARKMAKRKTKYPAEIINQVEGSIVSSEVEQRLREVSLLNLERIPEIRHLIGQLLELKQERQRIAESLGTLPHEDIEKLFRDYIEDHFDSYLVSFFDKLLRGITKVLARSIYKRLDQMEQSIEELKSSVLMSSINSFAWLEMEIIKETTQFLSTQPNTSATLKQIYDHIAYQTRIPILGLTLTKKYEYLIQTLRKTECIREYEGLLFELCTFEVIEEGSTYAGSENYGKILQHGLRQMDKNTTHEVRDGLSD